MDEKRSLRLSKFLSLVLRHKPEEVGLTLGENGWINVEDLLTAFAGHGQPLTLDELHEIVETSDKKRFAFDESERRIRANQGHSVAVEIEFERRMPPEVLYHGTVEKSLEKIFAEGLKKMGRQYVHLSSDVETARKVGARYGKPVVLTVDTRTMTAENLEFFISANGVWLVEAVPARFLNIYESE